MILISSVYHFHSTNCSFTHSCDPISLIDCASKGFPAFHFTTHRHTGEKSYNLQYKLQFHSYMRSHYRLPRLQWHRLQWHPAYGDSFDRSQMAFSISKMMWLQWLLLTVTLFTVSGKDCSLIDCASKGIPCISFRDASSHWGKIC